MGIRGGINHPFKRNGKHVIYHIEILRDIDFVVIGLVMDLDGVCVGVLVQGVRFVDC